MWGLIWSLFKAGRYLIPFIHESIRVRDKDDPEDNRASYNLRKLVIDGIMRFLVLVGIVFLIFYKILPMYSDNIYLRSEIEERNRIIQQYKDDMERLRDRLDAANENAKKAQSNLDMSISRNAAKDEETKRLSKALIECQHELTELRALEVASRNFKNNLEANNVENKHENNNSKSTIQNKPVKPSNNTKSKTYDNRWDSLE